MVGVRAARSTPVLIAVVLLAAACKGAGGGAAAGSTSTVSSSPVASGSSASGSASGPGGNAGCPSVGRAIPAGAHSAPTVDVDGDGRPDTEWIASAPDANGAVAFGVRTASGAVLSATISSASPVARSVMFADVTGHGEIIALASDGRQVLLYGVSECQIVPEKNAQGQQYAFDRGFTGYGTGVGCADATGDGVPDLLGLKAVTDAGGATTSIERTVVTLNGPQARNGAVSTIPTPTPDQVKQANDITCGNLTITANGVTTNP